MNSFRKHYISSDEEMKDAEAQWLESLDGGSPPLISFSVPRGSLAFAATLPANFTASAADGASKEEEVSFLITAYPHLYQS